MKKREDHITVKPNIFAKFLKICRYHKRTQRAQVTLWIEDEYEKLFGGGKDGMG